MSSKGTCRICLRENVDLAEYRTAGGGIGIACEDSHACAAAFGELLSVRKAASRRHPQRGESVRGAVRELAAAALLRKILSDESDVLSELEQRTGWRLVLDGELWLTEDEAKLVKDLRSGG